MPLPYRKFGNWQLSDLAIRKTEKDRVTFTSNGMCAQFLLPLRLPGETNREFAPRKTKFQKRLPRHSDFSSRIALALRAFMLSGEDSYGAAYTILKKLRTAPAKEKREYERAGIGHAFRPVNFPLGSTRRNRRTTRKKRGVSTEERLVHTIRTQAYRFIRKHKNFEKYFRDSFDSYRERFRRDEDWYASVEASTLDRVKAFEDLRGPFDWWAAMPVSAAAQFYHEQRKFEPALLLYRKAIQAAHRAIMHEDFRAVVLNWLHAEAERCKRSEPMGPQPDYRGPRLPISNSGPLQRTVE
jgi:hypothetical protein